MIQPLGVIEAAAPIAPPFGDPVPGLTADETARFVGGREVFEEEETAADGLGPVFNGPSCAACHGEPATGGGRAPVNGTTVLETRFGSLAGGLFDPFASQGDR